MAGTLTISTFSDGTNSTSATNCIQGSAKAWVSFNGTNGSIFASYNVSSVTRTSTGLYTVNFTNAFVDTNYAITSQGSSGNSTTRGRIVEGWASATSSATICGSTTSPAASDLAYVMCSFFR